MTRTVHNKLVRDLIPHLIRRDGARCTVDTLDQEAFDRTPRDKLVEEARQASEASSRDELIVELADLQEVIDALIEAQELTRQELRHVRSRPIGRNSERAPVPFAMTDMLFQDDDQA